MFKPFIKLVDVLKLDYAYQQLSSLVKRHTRLLSEEEIALAKMVFGTSIDYQLVRIDEYSYTAQQMRVKYVSFNTINSWGKMTADVLLHELTHIWQYQQLGSVYIAEALAAQRSVSGYNYGGVGALREALKEGKSLRDFNFEQQGDIVQDYFRLLHGHRPQWGKAKKEDCSIYKLLIDRGIRVS